MEGVPLEGRVRYVDGLLIEVSYVYLYSDIGRYQHLTRKFNRR